MRRALTERTSVFTHAVHHKSSQMFRRKSTANVEKKFCINKETKAFSGKNKLLYVVEKNLGRVVVYQLGNSHFL